MTNRNRRATQWYETISAEVVLTAQLTSGVDLLSNLATGNRQGSTVTRMILDMTAHPTALTVVNELYWGVAVMNADALAAAAFPDPETVDETNWLIHGRMLTRSSNLSGNEGDTRFSLDIRAQRILRSVSDRLVLVRRINTTVDMDVSFFHRVLVKHP